MEFKYNYYFYATNIDYYKVAYYDLDSLSFVKLDYSGIKNNSRICNFLFKTHFSSTINNRIDLPFKRIWYPQLFSYDFSNDKPICFVFFGREAKKYGSDYLIYLKNRYPRSKIAISFLDLIKNTLSDTEFYDLKKHADLIFTYDYGDAKKYDLLYQHDVFSKYPVTFNSKIKECDVFFLGKAKNRLREIIQAYDVFTANGISCEFYVTEVKTCERISRKNIHYLDKSMDYIENLQHVCSAKALLEIVQEGARGSTLRCCEAVTYGKILITNNSEAKKEPFYNEKAIKLFKSIDELKMIQSEEIRKPIKFENIDSISPVSFLERLEGLM